MTDLIAVENAGSNLVQPLKTTDVAIRFRPDNTPDYWMYAINGEIRTSLPNSQSHAISAEEIINRLESGIDKEFERKSDLYWVN